MTCTNWDRIIIGGGAAGLFASGIASERGEKVLVIEKRERPARKILVTGKGRCNLTNDCSPDDFIRNVRRNPRFLMSAIHACSPQDVMKRFENLGVPLKVERGNRVFPVSDKAMDIADALQIFSKQSGATIIQDTVSELIHDDTCVKGVRTLSGHEFFAPITLLCTGGLSYSSTGSSGDGYRLAQSVGHTIVEPKPSLVAIVCRDNLFSFSDIMGLSLKNVSLSLFRKDSSKIIYQELGEMLFTHFGISGPLGLTASTYMDQPNNYCIRIDCKPGLDYNTLDSRILRDFKEMQNKNILHGLELLLPQSIIPVVLKIAMISPDKKVNEITKVERQSLIQAIKCFPIEPLDFRPIEEAVITAGGVSTSEINPSNMRSKLIEGLAFAGEVIDVDAVTGGFNLQIAWSTATLAAK